MEPDKAHRTLNTALLVIVMAMITINTGSFGSGWSAHLIEAGMSLAILLVMLIMLRIGSRHLDSIQEYLELA